MFPDQWWLTLEPPWGTVQMLLPPITFKSSDLEQNTLQNGLMIEFLNSTTELNLDPLAGHAAKPTYWYWVVVKESTAFIAGHQVRRTGGSCSKDLNSPLVFREQFLFFYYACFLMISRIFLLKQDICQLHDLQALKFMACFLTLLCVIKRIGFLNLTEYFMVSIFSWTV